MSGPDAVGHREGQTFAGGSLWARFANLVKLPHTLFALPFALVGVVYASYSAPVGWRQIALVVLAFSAARFAAMGFNRIVDRGLDALNPRTRGRELPTGKLTVTQAAGAVTLASAVFVYSAARLNPLCLWLSPVALAWVLAYSYTKRFTHWSHLWLGISLAMAPAGGYLAVAGAWSSPPWTLLALSLSVATWVAGFDVFYALADEDFDRAFGLRSLVVKLGQRGSIGVAQVLHAVTLAGLLLFGWGAHLGALYFVGVALAGIILVREHSLVKPGDLSKLDAAFFTMNGVMSVVVFVFALGDRLL